MLTPFIPSIPGFEYYVHVNVLGRGFITDGLMFTHRLQARRRSRARMERDLPGRRKLRPALATAMAHWFIVCANKKRELTILCGPSGLPRAAGGLQSEARRKMR